MVVAKISYPYYKTSKGLFMAYFSFVRGLNGFRAEKANPNVLEVIKFIDK